MAAICERYLFPSGYERSFDVWLISAGVIQGKIFRRVNKVHRKWGTGMTEKAVWHIVKGAAKIGKIDNLSPD
jgi:hypothetical protein